MFLPFRYGQSYNVVRPSYGHDSQYSFNEGEKDIEYPVNVFANVLSVRLQYALCTTNGNRV